MFPRFLKGGDTCLANLVGNLWTCPELDLIVDVRHQRVVHTEAVTTSFQVLVQDDRCLLGDEGTSRLEEGVEGCVG